MCMFCFFKQKTAYEMRMCDWRSDVCSSDLGTTAFDAVTSTTFWADVVGTSAGWGATSFASIGLLWLVAIVAAAYIGAVKVAGLLGAAGEPPLLRPLGLALVRSEEHTSELQSLMRISYAVFCLKKKKNNTT